LLRHYFLSEPAASAVPPPRLLDQLADGPPSGVSARLSPLSLMQAASSWSTAFARSVVSSGTSWIRAMPSLQVACTDESANSACLSAVGTAEEVFPAAASDTAGRAIVTYPDDCSSPSEDKTNKQTDTPSRLLSGLCGAAAAQCAPCPRLRSDTFNM